MERALNDADSDTDDSDSTCSDDDAGLRRDGGFLPPVAPAATSWMRMLVVASLAVGGSSMSTSPSPSSVANGAFEVAEWRHSVQRQSRAEWYSQQCLYEGHSQALSEVVAQHSQAERGGLLRQARVRTPQRTMSAPVYKPCTFANAGFRCSSIRHGRADIKRIHNMLVDLGASISVLDADRAARMARQGAAEIVRYRSATVVPARVAGGGYISIVGTATVEFCLRDAHTGEWRPFKEQFHLVEGSKTCILGVTFHKPRGLLLDLEQRDVASYLLDDGTRFTTEVDVCAPGVVAAAAASSDPLVFSHSKTDITGYGFSTIRCRVPESFSGSEIYLSRLLDTSAFAVKAGLMVPEGLFAVKDGEVVFPVFNGGKRPVQIPAMTPLGRFSADMESRSAQADMSVEQIVESLHIESVDAADLASKKADVVLLLTAMRQGYFSDHRLGRSSVGEFHVDTPTVDSGERAPANIPSRPLNPEQLAAARKEFDKMVEQGVLVPSSSPWGAPIVMVRKPKGGWRLCLDYRAGNDLSVKQHYPLPRVSDCIDRIGDARYFASFDVLKAFWQIQNSASTQPKTAVNFPWGKWEFRTMPMGMQAASATYQRIMDVLLRDLDFCIGYIDDALCFSSTWQDHLTHVAITLDRIGGAGLTLNPSKCEIGKSSVLFLGHLISADGNRPDPSKISALLDAPFTEDKKALHHWVGLAGFYAPFMKDFSVVTEPLQTYIHAKPQVVNGKKVHAPPSQTVRDAFEVIRRFLCSDLLLARPDLTKPFLLKVDASVINGMGCTLAQMHEGIERPCSYWSTRWIESTANWAPVEHECYAFRRAVERYYEYLSSNHFTVYTDSEPLQWLQTLRRPRGRMAEWILELQSLDYTVIHRPGRLNVDSDALSRLALESTSINAPDRLSLPSPFEASSVTQPTRGRGPEVLGGQGHQGHRFWRRRLVAALLTDGVGALVLHATFASSGKGHVFPSIVKPAARHPNRELAVRALELAVGAGNSGSFRLAELGQGRLVKTENVAYVVFHCSASTACALLQAHVGSASTDGLSWLPLQSISPVHRDDERMLGRLRRSCVSLASCLFPVQHTVHFVGLTADGRSTPLNALSSHEAVYDALKRLHQHMSTVEGTNDDFIFFDLEYDMIAHGIDLIQLAAGRLIFVFDTLIFSAVLTEMTIAHPTLNDPEKSVPSLRFWLERPSTTVVLQACCNDATKLLELGVQPTSVFDTQFADAIIDRRREGRNLEQLIKLYLGRGMQMKSSVVHRVGLFRQRPLPQRLLDYAWQDVADGPALYSAMRCRLDAWQLRVVLELSEHRAGRYFRFERAAVVMHDGSRCLLIDGDVVTVQAHGLFDDGAWVKSSRVNAKGEWVRSKMEARRLARSAVVAALAAHHVENDGSEDKDRTLRTAIDKQIGALGKARLVGAVLCFFAENSKIVQTIDLECYRGCSVAEFKDSSTYAHSSLLQRVACHAWYWSRSLLHETETSQVAASSVSVRAASDLGCSAATRIQCAFRIYRAGLDLRHAMLLQVWARHAVSSLSHSRPMPMVTLNAIAGAATTAKPRFSYEPLSQLQAARYGPHIDPDEEDAPLPLAEVVVVAHNGGRCILLDRVPNARSAREADQSKSCLPALRVSAEVYGLYRAQHAIQMLFGPLKSYSSTADAYQSIRLVGLVHNNSSSDVIGVYECTLSEDMESWLPEVFAQRRCTPTKRALHPGYAFAAPHLDGLCQTDALAVAHVLGLEPLVAAFDAVPIPEVDSPEKQGDLSRAAKRRQRRIDMPGVQPSGIDVQSELMASYEDGSHIPRVTDPEALFRALVPVDSVPDQEELIELQSGDDICCFLRSIADRPTEGATVPSTFKQLARNIRDLTFTVVEGVLYVADDTGADESRANAQLRVVLPLACQKALITACHDGLGHPGIKRTLRAVKTRAWWPGMRAAVRTFIRECPTCLFNKLTPHRGRQHVPHNGLHPWHSVQMDVVHLHKTRSGREKALVFYERFSRDVEAFAVKGDVDTVTVLNIILFEIYPRHGMPVVLYTDRGSNLISDRARQFYKAFGVDLRAADAEMHTAVAGAERFNATLRELARATHFDHGFEWDLVLPLLVAWYKALVQSATGYSPFYLNHGRDPAMLPWDVKHGPQHGAASTDEFVRQQFAVLHLAWQCAQAAVAQQEEERRDRHDSRYQTNVTFAKGDRVLIRQAGRVSKMDMPYVGPFKVVEVLERDRFRVAGRQGAKHLHHEFHLSRLKLWPSGADAEEVYLDEDYFDVDSIVDHKLVKGEVLFRVRWTGYTAADDTYMAFKDMNAALGREALEYVREHGLAGDITGHKVVEDELVFQVRWLAFGDKSETWLTHGQMTAGMQRVARAYMAEHGLGEVDVNADGGVPTDDGSLADAEQPKSQAEVQKEARLRRLAARQARMDGSAHADAGEDEPELFHMES